MKKGLSNKKFARKYDVPQNALSTWLQKKGKILKAYEAGRTKQQRLKTTEFEKIDTATCRYLLSKRWENVPITELIEQTQAFELTKMLNITKFQASD